MKTVTLNGSGAGSTTLKLQPGKNYECGVGPHMAFESFSSGSEQPLPDFSFMPPKSVTVVVPADSNPTAVTFALLAASNTITGFVRDGSNTAIANVFVHAAPLGCFASDGSKKDCFGGFSQSKSDGSFTVNVAPGTYVVGADAPGMPPSSEVEVSVATDGTLSANGTTISSVTLKMVKGSTTISGVVKDESGNGIKYAHVSGQRIATGGSCSSFTPNGGGADSPTDASGNYTLYVADGTWCVRAFSPSYGEIGNKTVIVSSTSQSGQNLQATATEFGTISGTVTKGGSAASGAFVNCYGSSGGNAVESGSDGTYSMKVKAGSGYTCEGFIHGSGPLTPQSSITVASGGTTTVALSMGNPGTVNVTVTGISDAFVDVRDSNGRGNGTNQNSAGVYTIKVPAGTYTVRGGGPRYGELCAAQSVTVTAGGTSAVTCSPPANLRTVTGRVTNGSTNVAGATVTFISSSTGRAFSTTTSAVTGSSSNISLANVPDDTYNVIASKSGYEPATTTMTVASGSTALSSALAMTAASGANGTNVTVTVQLSGTAYTGKAKVIATKSGKTMVAETEKTTGQASVPLTNGTWSVKAIGDNGKESAATNVTISGGVLSGTAPTLSLSSSITGFTTTSDTSTFVPKSGGLIKPSEFTGLELNAPASTFSTSDSNTGKIEFSADPTLAGIDPGSDMNFVGASGYDITPKDSGGNTIKKLSGDVVTLTLPYTDADVTSAGVEEANLKCGSFNAASQAWETFPTVVDTTNNKLTCQIDHFSSFGVLGTASVSSGTPGRYYSPGGGGGSSTTTDATPAATTPVTTPATPASSALGRLTPTVTNVTAEDLRSGAFAYGAARVRALATEQGLAKYLASSLEGKFGKATFNALFRQAIGKSKAWWYSYVNAYTYGGYTLDEVVAGVKSGGKTVHPAIPASAWRGSADYKKYMK
ncbi:MAG: carboxypeptidase regulatory-like domain-containing protein [Patescibacteria group bacterium]